jgi:alpha-amylase
MSKTRHAAALSRLLVLLCAALPALPAGARAAGVEGWADEVLYFVVLDRFQNGDPGNDVAVDLAHKGAFHGGDLAGLTARLGELKELGVTAVWLTPVVKNIDGFVTGAGFPDWGYHGYWADDFTRLDPRFGTEAELRGLVKAAHARGLKVLLDVVYNHAGYGSRYLTEPKTKGWLRSGEACGKDELTSCLAGLPDFRTERPEVAEWLLDQQLGWAKRSGVDGFRLDTVKHLDHAFWTRHRERVRQELKAGFFLLGEVWGGDPEVLDPWFSRGELDAGFDFSFQGSALAFVQGRGRTVAFDRYLAGRHRVREGHLLAHYLSSHDVPGALHQLEGDTERFKLAAVLQMATLGLPTVYYGEEVGRRGGAWPENRSDMPAPGAGDQALRAFYKRLIAARRAHPALWRGAHRGLVTDGDVYAFARQDAASGDGVVVVVNRGAAPGKVSLEPLPEWGSRAVVDVLGGGAVPRGGEGRLALEVPPRSALLLTAGGR